MLLITNLGNVDTVRTLERSPLLAQAAAIMPSSKAAPGWTRQPLLYTSPHATLRRTHTPSLNGTFVVGWLLSRAKPQNQLSQSNDIENQAQQHIVILGDSDLFSQHYRQVAGNAALIDHIFNTLMPENSVMAAATPAPLTDQYISLSDSYLYGLAALLLAVLPSLWCTYYIYYQRKVQCRYR